MTDILVAGVGPAGTAYACAAARAGANVLLAGPPRRHAPHSLELLSGQARPVLERLGLTRLAAELSTPCAGILGRWGGAAIDRLAILDPEGGGAILDRAALDARLFAAAISAGCRHSNSVVDAAEPTARGWRARIAGSWHPTDRIVLATGRDSGLARRCGLSPSAAPPLVAIVGWVASPPDLGDRLCIADAEDGWWYGLGRGAGASLGICTDLDLLPPGPNRAMAGWRQALRQLGWAREIAVRPTLRLAHTTTLAGPVPEGMQVIGDAALAADPLSGRGLALAFETAWRAASDPAGYVGWLSQTGEAHMVQQQLVYAAAGRRGPFWNRRAAAPAPIRAAR